MTLYRENRISPAGLFFLLFVSRAVIAFTFSSSVTGAVFSFDLVMSLALSLAAAALLAVPAALCASRGISVTQRRPLSYLYCGYLVFSGALNIAKFAVFSSSELNKNAKTAVLAALMILACSYAATLGVEALSRFGSMVFVITLIGTAAVFVEGADDFSYLDIFPLVQNGSGAFLNNVLFSVCSTNELVLFCVLAPRVNGGAVKPLYLSLCAAYLAASLLVAFAVGVLGSTASLSDYPLFDVARLSKLGSGERLEAVFTALWIFAAFLKASLFIYCAADCLSPNRRKQKVWLCGAGVLAVSLAVIYGGELTGMNAPIAVSFLIFAFVLPLIALVTGGKRNEKG